MIYNRPIKSPSTELIFVTRKRNEPGTEPNSTNGSFAVVDQSHSAKMLDSIGYMTIRRIGKFLKLGSGKTSKILYFSLFILWLM